MITEPHGCVHLIDTGDGMRDHTRPWERQHTNTNMILLLPADCQHWRLPQSGFVLRGVCDSGSNPLIMSTFTAKMQSEIVMHELVHFIIKQCLHIQYIVNVGCQNSYDHKARMWHNRKLDSRELDASVRMIREKPLWSVWRTVTHPGMGPFLARL